MCDLRHKKVYLAMLRYGCAQVARHGTTASAARGFKFIVLAKLVTVGIEHNTRQHVRQQRESVDGAARLDPHGDGRPPAGVDGTYAAQGGHGRCRGGGAGGAGGG